MTRRTQTNLSDSPSSLSGWRAVLEEALLDSAVKVSAPETSVWCSSVSRRSPWPIRSECGSTGSEDQSSINSSFLSPSRSESPGSSRCSRPHQRRKQSRVTQISDWQRHRGSNAAVISEPHGEVWWLSIISVQQTGSARLVIISGGGKQESSARTERDRVPEQGGYIKRSQILK